MLLPFVSSTPVSSPSNTAQRTSYGDLINALPNLLAALDFSNLDPPSHQKTGADRTQANSAHAYRSPDTGYGVPAAPVITSNAVEPSTGYGVPAAPPINHFAPAPLDSYGAPQAAPIIDSYGSPELPAPAYEEPAPAYEEPASTYEIRPLPVPSDTSCHSPPPGWVCSYQTTTETECETIYEEIEDENGKLQIAKQVPREECKEIPVNEAHIYPTDEVCFVPCEDDAPYDLFSDQRFQPYVQGNLKHPGIKRSQRPSAGFVIPQYTKRPTSFQTGQSPYHQLHLRIQQKSKQVVEEVGNTLHTLRRQAPAGDEAECYISCEDYEDFYGSSDYGELPEPFLDQRYKPQDEVNLKRPGIKRNQHPSPGFAIPRSDNQLTPTQAGRRPNPKIDQKPKGALEEVTDTLQKLGRQAYEWNVSMLSKISSLFL